MTVGGWYDGEDLFGALETHRAGAAESGHHEPAGNGTVDPRGLEPLGRGQTRRPGISAPRPGTTTGNQIELPFFRRYPKDDTNFIPTEAHLFETGTDRWRRFEAWPPPTPSSAGCFQARQRAGVRSPVGVLRGV